MTLSATERNGYNEIMKIKTEGEIKADYHNVDGVPMMSLYRDKEKGEPFFTTARIPREEIMTHWRYTLDIKDEYKEAKAGTLTPHEMAHRIAAKIEALPVKGFVIREIIDAFNDITEGDTFDDANDVMEALYDWGDAWYIGNSKRCWIATF